MKKYILLLLLLLMPICSQARDGWTLQILGGTAINARSPIVFHQDGFSDIEFTAQYDTKPFYDAPYYAWRLANWKGDKAWELELIHHKLYLQNPPPDVQYFNVSHGYNLITINRAWKKGSLIYHLGVGAVLAHPESIVRNQNAMNLSGGPFGGGEFYWSGITTQASIERRYQLNRRWHLTLEFKATASYATMPIANGTVDVPNMAVHGLFGFGYTW